MRKRAVMERKEELNLKQARMKTKYIKEYGVPLNIIKEWETKVLQGKDVIIKQDFRVRGTKWKIIPRKIIY